MIYNNLVHPFATTGAIDRLKEELETYGKPVVGFDFDNTIFGYHNNGRNYNDIIEILQKCKRLGFTLCLFTSESNEEKLKRKVTYCKYFGIEPDYVNDSPLFPGTKKPFFSILLDDRAGLKSAYCTLANVINYANFKSYTQGG